MVGRFGLRILAALILLGLLVGLATPASATTPLYSSGQTINVVVPANSTFAAPNNSSAVNIVECSAPNGVIPTQTSACDGNTVQGSAILPNDDGSFTYDGYEVFALPDSITLVEGPGGPVCGDTAETECILYIGNNESDFSQPHQWSEPFFVQANSDDGGENPGDTPLTTQSPQPPPQLAEVSAVLVLPILALALIGGVLVASRRRTVAYHQGK
ncbi:MAG: hypothetical protein ACLPYY_09585 [Acidimicrobiales bacterium]